MGRITLFLAAALLVAAAAPAEAYHRHHHYGHYGHYGHGLPWGPFLPFSPYSYVTPYPYVSPYVVPQAPSVVIQQPPYVQPQQSQPAQQYWYYCTDPSGYHPYVPECPGGWLKVVPTPPE